MAYSRPYRITTREVLQETITASDSVSTTMDLPPVLPPGRMTQITNQILGEHGFKSGHGGDRVRDQEGVTVVIEPDTGRVTASIHATEHLDLSGESDDPGGCPCSERGREAVREGLRKALRSAADDKARELQDACTDQLEEVLAGLACELETISNQVTSKALVEKAATLGEIKSIVRDNDTGSMTILVEV